jgi:hypothetical protein
LPIFVDFVARCTSPHDSQKYRPCPLNVSLRVNAARHCCNVASPFGPSPTSGSTDGDSGVDGGEPFALTTGGIGNERSRNGSLRVVTDWQFMHVTRVTATPPKMSIILSADASSLSTTGLGVCNFGDTGDCARALDDGDIISVSCRLTSSAVTPCESLEGGVNTLPGVLKFVLDVRCILFSSSSSASV